MNASHAPLLLAPFAGVQVQRRYGTALYCYLGVGQAARQHRHEGEAPALSALQEGLGGGEGTS